MKNLKVIWRKWRNLLVFWGQADPRSRVLDLKSDLKIEELCSAIRVGDMNKLKDLLAAGTSPNGRLGNWPENTPLHVATQHFHPDCVAALLEVGADPSARNGMDMQPLHALFIFNRGFGEYATQSEKSEILGLLLHAGADPLAKNRSNEMTAMDMGDDHMRGIMSSFVEDRVLRNEEDWEHPSSPPRARL